MLTRLSSGLRKKRTSSVKRLTRENSENSASISKSTRENSEESASSSKPRRKDHFQIGDYAEICDSGRMGKIVKVDGSSWPIQVWFYDNDSPSWRWCKREHLRMITKERAIQYRQNHMTTIYETAASEGFSLSSSSDDASKSNASRSTGIPSDDCTVSTRSCSDVAEDQAGLSDPTTLMDPSLKEGCNVIFRKACDANGDRYAAGDRGTVLEVLREINKVKVLIRRSGEVCLISISEVCALPVMRDGQKFSLSDFAKSRS